MESHKILAWGLFTFLGILAVINIALYMALHP
jgi:hypothetical protein